MLTCTILPNGNLEITPDNEEAIEWLKEELAEGKRTSEDLLWDATEGYWTNGSFTPFSAGDANPFVGLTNAPCIAEDLTVEDNGDRTIEGRLWWYPNYQILDFAEVLLADGRVVFDLAPE